VRRSAASSCNEVVVNIAEMETLLTRNRIWVDRTRDVGVISKADAIDYGLSGPNLRGSGVDYDLRKAQPYLCYPDLEFDVPVGSVGDCYDRYLVRMEEMRQSVRILHQCLDKIPGGATTRQGAGQRGRRQNRFAAEGQKVLSSMEELIHQFMLVTQGVNVPPGEIYFGHENPEGRTGLLHQQQRRRHAVPDEDPLALVCEPEHPCRELLPGHMMSDTVAILGSLDFVMGECDR
jgi:NADH-quinone oxidoreductase subunit D